MNQTTNPVRPAAVAGQFYPNDKKSLLKELQDCFVHTLGVGKQPSITKGDIDIKAVIVPHAGYMFSGPVASHAYYQITANGFADNFIIIGPNHTAIGSPIALMNNGIWQTPLGDISINSDLSEKLKSEHIQIDSTAHYYEHSIEVQLPFLQFCASHHPFSFVPLAMMNQEKQFSEQLGKLCADTIKASSNKTVLIASSDFSHVGFNYQSMPPKNMPVHTYAKQQDTYALQKILHLDASGLLDVVHEKNISLCGYGPISAVLTASKLLGATRAKLLKYATSYEIQPASSCVGYAAIIIY
jgi:MEMO1 family protein